MHKAPDKRVTLPPGALDPGRPKPPVASSQTNPHIPPCLIPNPLIQGTGGEILGDFERDRSNYQMNWITWAIGAGNAPLLEMFQHKIVQCIKTSLTKTQIF
jgi:hypothetical protein